MMKIYLYPILSTVDSNTASTLINFLTNISVESTARMQEISYVMLKKRLNENSFKKSLDTYLDRLGSIEVHVRER